MALNTEYDNLVKKWDLFLKKINNRFEESTIQAEEAILDNLEVSNFDLTQTLIALSGIKEQLRALSDKIETTFEKTVKPQMLQYKEEWDILDQAQKGIQLGESIYERIDRFLIILEGKIAQKFYEHAIEFLNESFNCKQCGGSLEVGKNIFRSHYVSCDYCNTVNTFIPNSKVNEIQGYAIDHIARYNTLAEHGKMLKAQRELSELPYADEPENKDKLIQLFNNREQAEKAYWQKYFKERIKLQPNFEETFEYDVAVKMRYFYEERKQKLNY